MPRILIAAARRALVTETPPAAPRNGRASHPPALPHTLTEDAYGIAIGVLFVTFGATLLKPAGLLTGGVTGIALLTSYVSAQPVGLLFLLVNLPFFLFGYFFMGARFTIKSMMGSAMIMTMLQLLPKALDMRYVQPVLAALAGGTMVGMGILAFARHGAGVGGTGIVTLWLQKKYGINAGRTQIAIDSVILLVALTVVAPDRVGWSAVSAVAMSTMVITWHRPGRYSGS